MTPTDTSTRPDPTRSGAVWVTGMGAFLLLAAAAVFTAVRWDQIPDAAKLAALVAATGACLVAGRGLRATLPASAGALFHLGAFLVPVDVAAIAIHAQLHWSTLLLAQGAVATTTFALGARSERSVVLRWATGAAVVVLAGGIAATTPLPAPVVLAGLAGAALFLARDEQMAVAWAGFAALAPIVAGAEELPARAHQVMERLGLVGDRSVATAVLTGVASAVVLATVGRRRESTGLALLGIGAAGLGALVSWSGLDQDTGPTLTFGATAFLVVELAALTFRRDPFWARPTAIVARLAEVPAVLATFVAGLVVVFVDWLTEPAPVEALALSALALAWLAADQRTDGRGTFRSTLGMGIAAVAAVAVATASTAATGSAMVLVAAVAVLVPSTTDERCRSRRGAHLLAVVCVLAGPVAVAGGAMLLAAGLGLAGAAIVVEAAVRRSRLEDPVALEAANRAESWSWVLMVISAVPLAAAVAAFVEATERASLGLALGAVAATLLAAQADRGRTTTGPTLPFGTILRLHPLWILGAAVALPAVELGVVAVVTVVLSAGDAVRLRRPEVALGASLGLPVAVGALAHATGLSLPSTGVALTVGAAVIAGLGTLLGSRWAVPVVAALGASVGAGIVFAAGDPASLGDATIVSSAIALAAAVATQRIDGVYAAGAVMTAGIWLRLADGEIGISEPYLAPVAALLLLAGMRAQRGGVGSWIAYGPVVGLLGGSALAERMSGGSAWHSVIAGAVGVVAVAVGGDRRLAAPLFLGSGLLVTLVVFETLAITAGFPTWVWLALGGSTLLGAGVAMERHDVGPLETGRRLVDVVNDRYT